MKTHFQSEVESLNDRVRRLGERVLDQVRRAAAAIRARDPAAAARVSEADLEVDREEVRIEEECLRILALYAPVADELRYIFGVTKVNHELERIGDLAKKVARLAAPTATLMPDPMLDELAVAAEDAAARALAAFFAQDAEKARAVWENDANIDAIHDRLCGCLDEALARRDGAPMPALLARRSVVSALERIGDHAARIAKVTLYMRHGEILRHRPTLIARPRVLFVCVHNSARSQMAEAWLRHLYGDRFEAESAGLEPGVLNPLAVEVMREVGIDISNRRTQAVLDLVKAGRLYAYVITVCDETAAERCPIFPGVTRREHWSFPDPARFTGTPEEQLAQARQVRDAIRARIEEWVRGLSSA